MPHKILIADDAAFMRIMLKDILNQAGYINTVEAKNGRDAINLFKVERPKLVLLDVTMPDMDGIHALAEIKNINPDAKVIMCSSMGQEDVVSECFEEGADDFIMKPFKPERVIQAVSQFVDLNN